MSVSQDLICHRTLPLPLFEQLGQLLQQMAQAVGTEALLLTEAVLAPIPLPPESSLEQKFTLLVSQRFSALLAGSLVSQAGEQGGLGSKELAESSRLPLSSSLHLPITPTRDTEFPIFPEPLRLNARLTFDPKAIARFLTQLSDLLQHQPQAVEVLSRYRQTLQPNDATLQSEFTLLLLSILTPQPMPESATVYPCVSVCQPIEDALRQQIANERLLNQVTTQIRQSLELPAILATAIERVREFLQLDRLVIYQFTVFGVRGEEDSAGQRDNGMTQQRESLSPHLPISSSPHSPISPIANLQQWQPSGCVVYEARATAAIPSVLNYREQKCFFPNSQCWEKYRQGFTLAIDDVNSAYTLSKCLLGFLQATQVRAKLAAPIVFQSELWGLLIAHQCNAPRHWQEQEKNLLGQVAEQLAIAIHQAELMRSLQQEKQTLEQRVVERTQALHEALIAAQSASRAKSEFLATMSHELRTPLTSVIGMSSTLLRWSLGELNQRQRQYLQTIHDSGERLLSLINSILELSQLQAGRSMLNLGEISLNQLAQDCWQAIASAAPRQAVNLKLDLQLEPSGVCLITDSQRVQQILGNLLSNAIKFTSPGGQVVLRVWVENDTAVFQVEDTGIGIPAEQLPLLFEKFQQLDPPYRRRYDGMGLGLALTKQLVELLQGRIEVESTVGVGSSFTVWLPGISHSQIEY